MNLVQLAIDGKEVKVTAGTTVLKAADQAGVPIPRLCYDRELVPFGACRLCVVEIKGMRNLPASCVTTVSSGGAYHYPGRDRSPAGHSGTAPGQPSAGLPHLGEAGKLHPGRLLL